MYAQPNAITECCSYTESNGRAYARPHAALNYTEVRIPRQRTQGRYHERPRCEHCKEGKARNRYACACNLCGRDGQPGSRG